MEDKKEKFIKSYEIAIGQSAIMGFPIGPKEDAVISLCINEHGMMMKLVDFKNMANTLWEEYGTGSEKGQEAIRDFRALFAELLSPYFDLQFMLKKEIKNDK